MILPRHRQHHLVFSPNGKAVAAKKQDNSLAVWDIATGERLLDVTESHTGRIRSAVFLPDGKSGLTSSDEGTVRLWDAGVGKQLRVYQSETRTKGAATRRNVGGDFARWANGCCWRLRLVLGQRVYRVVQGMGHCHGPRAFRSEISAPSPRLWFSPRTARRWRLARGIWLKNRNTRFMSGMPPPTS